jgi:hypothetical protein
MNYAKLMMVVMVWTIVVVSASCSDDPAASNNTQTDPVDAGASDVADDADVGGVCSDECADESLAECVDGGLRSCQDLDDDGCLEWSQPQACGDNAQCTAGECVATCTDEPCTEAGSISCSEDRQATVVCGDFDDDGCLEWGGEQSCSTGESCSNNTCAASCSDECTSVDAKRCDAGAVVTCDDFNSDGCLEWGERQECASGQFCNLGACEGECVSECSSVGSKQCNEAGNVETCFDSDGQGCLKWGTPTTCGQGLVCADGACAATCSDECSADGDLRCSPGASDQWEACSDHDSDGCLEWGSAQGCASGEVCSSGTCATTCTDECTTDGEKTCQSNSSLTCGQFDSDSCLEWGDEVQCAVYEQCNSGSCEPTSPPATVVISEVLYDSQGADEDVFVEVYGPAGTDLAGFRLVGVNGYNGDDYNDVTLAGTIGSDGLFLVADPASAFAASADQTDADVDYQNGPDNIELRWGEQVVDAVGYGTFGASETFAGEGSPAVDVAGGHSLSRDDSYTDTDDNSADFYDTASPTPGAANVVAVCGDGVVDSGEVCDQNCPASCDDADACTADTSTGSAQSCDLVCANAPITQCVDADGCCPSGCTAANDTDCLPPGDHIWSRLDGDSEAQQATDVAMDANGNVVVVGYFTGAIDLGGGVLTAGLGDDDIFIAKYDRSGNHLWSNKFGDDQYQFAESVEVDGAGNVVVTGSNRGTVDFGGGALTAPLTSNQYTQSDIFLVKFDPSGNHVWSKSFGTLESEEGLALAIDDDDNVVLTAKARGEVDLGGGPLTFPGVYNAVVAKFDPSGTHLWSVGANSYQFATAEDLAVDASGNVFVVGHYEGSINFGGSTLSMPSGTKDEAFVAKFDASGNHLWSSRYGDIGEQRARSVAVDASGNVVVAGDFKNAIDFGINLTTTNNRADVFVAKLDGSGGHIWSHQFGDAGYESVGEHSLAVGPNGVIYMAGPFNDGIDFGGGVMNSAGQDDAFVAAFDAAGAHQWSLHVGNADRQYPLGLAVGGGSVAVAGWSQGAVDFGGGTVSGGGDDDAFLVTLVP